MALKDKVWLNALAIAVLLAGPLGTLPALAQEAEGVDVVEPGEAAEEAADLAEEGAEEETEEEESAETPEEEAAEEEAAETAKAMGDALGVTILSVASLTGGIAFLAGVGSTRDRADAAAASGDLRRQSDLEDRADREKALGITLTSLGIVLAGVATWLWIDYVRTNEAAGDDTSVTLMPSFDPRGGAGLFLGGRF